MKRHWFSLLCSVFVSLRPTVPARSLHNRHNRGADSVVGPEDAADRSGGQRGECAEAGDFNECAAGESGHDGIPGGWEGVL